MDTSRPMPVVLSIAGSDSSGGAGIQADVRTITALGAWPRTVVTAITAQGGAGVTAAAAVDEAVVRAQLAASLDDDVAAAKTGMLATGRIVRAVAAVLRARRPAHVVCDPVLRATAGTGAALLDEAGVAAWMSELLPLATVVTPNVPEAERLTGITVHDVEDAERAGRDLVARGAGAALVTGGHLDASAGTDVLVTPAEVRTFPGEWIDAPPVHGTGCVHSAALATALARGDSLPDAIVRARAAVRDVIRAAPARPEAPSRSASAPPGATTKEPR